MVTSLPSDLQISYLDCMAIWIISGSTCSSYLIGYNFFSLIAGMDVGAPDWVVAPCYTLPEETRSSLKVAKTIACLMVWDEPVKV
jgi:hypothetical protein